MDEGYASVLEGAKRASTLQVLFRCARLLDARAVAWVRELTGLATLRPAHTALLPHIDLEGTRQTELARRLGVTKQAVLPLIDELERMGVVERGVDPKDGRARLVRFTSRGREGLLHGLGVLRALEASLDRELGPGSMDRLRAELLPLLDLVEGRGSPEEGGWAP